MIGRSAFVLTVSDRSADGRREDTGGPAVADRLAALGYRVERAVVPDEAERIVEVVRDAAMAHELVVTTGGTGLGPRDVTPQALRGFVDYEVPGLGEAMRAEGRRFTPFASLSRSFGAVAGRTLILALPGNPRGALESLDAVTDLLEHAIDTLRSARHEPPAQEPPAA